MAAVVVSLDCEGLWGRADQLDRWREQVTMESLTRTYRSLIGLLDAHEIATTFAFVSLFASNLDEIDMELDVLNESASHRWWTGAVKSELARRRSSGWSLPEAVDWAQASGRHEIASHSCTHIPLLQSLQPHDVAAVELDGVARWAIRRGLDIRTYIFPRNQISSVELLATHDILGFRDAPKAKGRFNTGVDEMNIFAKADFAPTSSRVPVKIPAGDFMNWRYEIRRVVPAFVTRLRWKHILRDAADNDGVAHLWLHPEDLITGHKQIELLALMLGDTREMVARGDLRSLTQIQWVRDHTLS